MYIDFFFNENDNDYTVNFQEKEKKEKQVFSLQFIVHV